MRYCLLFILVLFVFSLGESQTKSSLKIPTISSPLFWHNTPKRSTMKAGVLTIVAGEKTDLFRDPNGENNINTAPKLMFKADPNFTLSASIQHPFTNKFDAGGLVIVADSLNWIKFCFEKDYTGARRVVSVVTKGISDDCNSVELEDDAAFFKVAKSDNVVTLYYSTNGRKWLLVRHFQFESKNNVNVGFLAQSPKGKGCTVTFSDISYQTKKIKDPYTGE